MTTTDFTGCQRYDVNSYGGADTKQKVVLDGQVYMLKFGKPLEPDPSRPLQASHSNMPFSEHLGCRICEELGLPAQETILGTYEGRPVVACKDFIADRDDRDDLELVEFKKLENSLLGSPTAAGRTPQYDNLIRVFEEHPALEGIRESARERYWKTFAVDALIGNFDRHAGNWGYILRRSEDRLVALAPVYDCGSSLYPQLSESAMAELVRDRTALESRVRTFPTAALRMGKRRVPYHEFLTSPQGAEARTALLDLYQRLDLDAVRQLIWETPLASDLRREFYATLVTVREETILRPAYELAIEEQAHDRSVQEQGYDLASESRDMIAASKELAIEETTDEHTQERTDMYGEER